MIYTIKNRRASITGLITDPEIQTDIEADKDDVAQDLDGTIFID